MLINSFHWATIVSIAQRIVLQEPNWNESVGHCALIGPYYFFSLKKGEWNMVVFCVFVFFSGLVLLLMFVLGSGSCMSFIKLAHLKIPICCHWGKKKKLLLRLFYICICLTFSYFCKINIQVCKTGLWKWLWWERTKRFP